MSNHGSILFIAKGGSIQSETGDIIASVDSSGNATIPASVQLVMSDGESINDTNSNELLKFGVTASAVNEVTLTNAATGNAPSLSATGGDTDVSVIFSAKGAGYILHRTKFSVLQGAAASKTTSTTLTAIVTGKQIGRAHV